ncbi:hypothetical protein T459_23064 [Capsicum annuum]|uniref:U-box domain-containing protein n=1 Tax=Capsicum annuum TaxID=4072 RepID=A0A2G2YRB3_CAPAN|nr:hypothetical protein T459_23064 [Capsicum annuum]
MRLGEDGHDHDQLDEVDMQLEELKEMVLQKCSYKDKSQDLFNAVGSMYAAFMFLGIHNLATVQSVLAIECIEFYRERAAAIFSALPYTFGQDVMEDPHIAADGYTYEGNAIKG